MVAGSAELLQQSLAASLSPGSLLVHRGIEVPNCISDEGLPGRMSNQRLMTVRMEDMVNDRAGLG